MTNSNILHAIFDDEEVLLSSVKELRSNQIEITEVYTPFPVHGLDHAMGLKETRMAITSFIYGCIGITFAGLMIFNIMIIDWPMNIGGKPNFTFYHNLPSFVPVMFECTVLFAAHLMAITYYFRCGLYPGKKTDQPDPRTTDDMFLVEIETHGATDLIKKILKKSGAIEINDKIKKSE